MTELFTYGLLIPLALVFILIYGGSYYSEWLFKRNYALMAEREEEIAREERRREYEDAQIAQAVEELIQATREEA